MPEICIRELAEAVEGQLQFGSMPPLGGDLEPIGRVVSPGSVPGKGDVVIYGGAEAHRETQTEHCVEEAFAQGALGAVSTRQTCPWPGRFSIQVADVGQARRKILGRLADGWPRPLLAVVDPRGVSPLWSRLAHRLGAETVRRRQPYSNFQSGTSQRSLMWQCLQSCQAQAGLPLQVRDADDWRTVAGLCQPDILVRAEPADDGLVKQIIQEMPEGGIVIAERATPELEKSTTANRLALHPARPLPRLAAGGENREASRAAQIDWELTGAALAAVILKWESITLGHPVSA